MPTRIPVLFLLLSTLPLLSQATDNDYQQELQQIDSRLQDSPENHPLARLQQTYYQFQRASLTATARDYTQAREQLAELTANEADSHIPPVQLLAASLHIKLHNLKAAAAVLEQLPASPQKTLLLADIDLQNGAYRQAREKLAALPEAMQDWNYLARMARIAGQTGDTGEAASLYEQAAGQLTGNQMRDYAWLMLQVGKLHMENGQPEQAWAYYQRADTAYSGYWMVAKHKAEWLAGQEQAPEAISVYRELLDSEPDRPELAQALGEAYYVSNAPLVASYWLEQARQGYEDSANRGEIHYLHHYTELLSEFMGEPDEAIRWAMKDLDHRQSFHSYDALAWAYYQAGRMDEARKAISRALEDPRPDAEMRYHASVIFHHSREP